MGFIVGGIEPIEEYEEDPFGDAFQQTYGQGVALEAQRRERGKDRKLDEREVARRERESATGAAAELEDRTARRAERRRLEEERARAEAERAAAQKAAGSAAGRLQKQYGDLTGTELGAMQPGTFIGPREEEEAQDPELAAYLQEQQVEIGKMAPKDAEARLASLGEEMEGLRSQKRKEKTLANLEFLHKSGALNDAGDEEGQSGEGIYEKMRLLIEGGDGSAQSIQAAVKLLEDHQRTQALLDRDLENLLAFKTEADAALAMPGPFGVRTTPEGRAKAQFIRNMATRNGLRGADLESAQKDFIAALYDVKGSSSTKAGADEPPSLKDAHAMAMDAVQREVITPEQVSEYVASLRSGAMKMPGAPGQNGAAAPVGPPTLDKAPKSVQKIAEDAIVEIALNKEATVGGEGVGTLGDLAAALGFSLPLPPGVKARIEERVNAERAKKKPRVKKEQTQAEREDAAIDIGAAYGGS